MARRFYIPLKGEARKEVGLRTWDSSPHKRVQNDRLSRGRLLGLPVIPRTAPECIPLVDVGLRVRGFSRPYGATHYIRAAQGGNSRKAGRNDRLPKAPLSKGVIREF